MTAPNVEVWALPAAGEPVCLSDLGDFELSRVDGDVGSVSLDYPATGESFELLHELRKPYRRLAVEIRTDGTAATARRAILTDAKGDSTKPGSTWTITGLYAGMRMAHASCLYSEDGENGDTVISGTPGVIIRTLMIRAQAEGVLLNVDFSSFTNTTDSNGDVWAKDATLTFSPGRDYLSILQEMRNKLGLCEWDFREDDEGAELFLYNPDSRGVDHSLPGQQVTLEYGRDFTDGPVTSSNREVGTTVLGVGVNGMYVEAENTEALALLGEKIQVYKDFGSVYDEATLEALTVAAAEQAGVGAHSYSHELILGPDSPQPGVDYDLTDWVLRAVNGTAERLKVSQLVLRRSNGVVTCSVTLGDLQVDQEVKTRQMLESLADGSSIVGTSTLQPDTDDGKAPGTPVAPTVASTAYYDGGTPVATLAASWPPVLVNDDGTAMDDLSGYEVQYRYEPGQSLPTAWQIGGITSATSLTWGPVVQGKAVSVRVRAYDKYDRDGAWSPEKAATTGTDADAPPVPSTPQAAPYLGILTVFFDGLGSSGQAMPSDLRDIEIHLSTVGPLFTPDRPTGGLALSTTYVGSLSGSGTFPVAVGEYGTTYYAKLVAVDKTGNASAASAAGSAVLVQASDGDIGGLSIGKLTAGIMSALMTISGIIRTAAAGARVELDTTGLRCISSTGAVLFEFHIPTSLLTMAGKLIAGAGAGLGATVVIDPAIAGIDLFPNATNLRTRIRARSTTRPDASTAAGFEIDTINASGQTDGFSLWAWSTNVYQGFRNTSGQFVGPKLILERTGVAGLFGDNTVNGKVQTGPAGQVVAGNDNGLLVIEPSGNIQLNTTGANIQANRAMGTTGNGHAFKAQGSDDEGYRFVVAGGSLAIVRNSNNQYVSISQGGNAYKTFVIPHPVDPDRWLVHVAVEAPEAQIEHRGVVELVDGGAVVELPAYWDAATVPGSGTVHLTMQLPAEPDRVVIDSPMPPTDLPGAQRPPIEIPESARVFTAAASIPAAGRFRVASPAPDGTRFTWIAKGTRADGPPVDVEPLRESVDVLGDGPYRHLASRSAA